MPIGNSMICGATMDLGYKDNCMLGGNADDYISLGYFRGCDPSIDPYCVGLEDLPRKVMWTTFFNLSYDFPKAFAKVKRILILLGVILVIASYLVFPKLWSQDFDKLLRTLMISALVGRVLKL